VKRSAHVPYSALQMFDLVNDVEAYPKFLPWCEWARVEASDGDSLEASIGVGVAGLRKSFRTRNKLVKPSSIAISLVTGPFRTLEGEWRFIDAPSGGCDVTLALDFEVASSPLRLAFELLFEEIARRQVAAFAERARTLYG
jgi:ribosome-associated toxin RatA of RatAB toxin-antitoxin module